MFQVYQNTKLIFSFIFAANVQNPLAYHEVSSFPPDFFRERGEHNFYACFRYLCSIYAHICARITDLANYTSSLLIPALNLKKKRPRPQRRIVRRLRVLYTRHFFIDSLMVRKLLSHAIMKLTKMTYTWVVLLSFGRLDHSRTSSQRWSSLDRVCK